MLNLKPPRHTPTLPAPAVQPLAAKARWSSRSPLRAGQRQRAGVDLPARQAMLGGHGRRGVLDRQGAERRDDILGQIAVP